MYVTGECLRRSIVVTLMGRNTLEFYFIFGKIFLLRSSKSGPFSTVHETWQCDSEMSDELRVSVCVKSETGEHDLVWRAGEKSGLC